MSRYAIKWRFFFIYIFRLQYPNGKKKTDADEEETKITFDFVIFEKKRDLTLSVDEIG